MPRLNSVDWIVDGYTKCMRIFRSMQITAGDPWVFLYIPDTTRRYHVKNFSHVPSVPRAQVEFTYVIFLGALL